jgi:SAM-dependent methyltransferase
LTGLYDNPEYYDIAFSFRDVPAEVDVMEESMRRFGRRRVARVLEMGCGNCPHLGELVARGYDYFGIDNNAAMLNYARRKIAGLGLATEKIRLIEGDMVDFALDVRIDFAFIMLGSLYITNTAELVSHFDAVGRTLQSGGLYFLDWCVDFDPHTDVSETWEAERNGVHLRVTCMTRRLNRVEQTYEEHVTLEVNDHAVAHTITDALVKRAIYPQEFLAFVARRPEFEFVGWWNDWDLEQPLHGDRPVNRPIIILRRK